MSDALHAEARKRLPQIAEALGGINFSSDEAFETALGSFLALYFLKAKDPCASTILFVDRVTSVVEFLVAERSKA